jgi:MFS family permease
LLGRRYWTLWASTAIANLGDGVFQLAVALLAVQVTRSPALVAGVALAARLPWLVVALPAGALADRLDRRATMLRANVARVVILTALAASEAVGATSIGTLYVVALGLGVAEVMFDTSSQTLMPSLVERDLLARANGRLFAAELVMNQFIGPPLGGALVAMSAAIAIGSSAGMYLVAAVALAMLPGSYRAPQAAAPTRLRTDIGEGLRYLFGHRVLRTLGLLLGAQNLLITAMQAVFILYLTSKTYGLGLPDVGVGLIFTLNAVGGVIGSFVAAPMQKRFGRAALLSLTIVLDAVFVATPALTRNVVLVGAASVLVGTTAIWNVVTVSLRQRIIPDRLLGRVNSAYRLLGWGSMPVGAALGGAIGQLVSVRAVFLVSGALVLLLLIPLRVVITDDAIAEAEREAEASRAS